MRRAQAGLLGAAVLLWGCTAPSEPAGAPSAAPSAAPSLHSPAAPLPSGPHVTLAPAPRAHPDDLRVATAISTVRHLAGRIGPRHATSAAARRAGRWVAGRFAALGYDVQRPSFQVPGGVSWGVPVPAGRSVNVVATSGPVDRSRPHVVVGAHLDTVPQAPGAEDNASGVGVLLAVAEAVADRRTRLPVVLVAFGAEEPRGPTDDDHHYGSRAYVTAMGPAERRALRGMVALDRVGVGTVLPVCSAGEPDALRAELLAAASRAGVRSSACTGNRASDHWSFARSGLPGARLGSTPFAGYHSAGDVLAVVDAAQLRRAGRTVVAWLSRDG
ncbi:MAG TPA: M28 family peptidase [Marmoricola sp.]|nr:M28 family peptidase [Marmoricola sp.]